MTQYFLWALIAAILVLNVFDYISTSLVIKKGRGTEANPIEALAMKYLGPNWWLSKLIFLPLCYGLYVQPDIRVSLGIASVLTAVFIYVVYNNYMVLWRHS